LEKWAEEIGRKEPLSKQEELSRALEEAINREEYELAAKLRDDIVALNTEDID
jgi:protein-arginine kinase activator protein McsA